MKKCSYCGRENDAAAMSCRECGTSLAEPEDNGPKTPRKPRVRLGLCVILFGLLIGAVAVGVPVLFAKRHLPGTIYVSLTTLVGATLTVVYGVAFAWVGIERAHENRRALWWIAFIVAIFLSIFLFNFLGDLGYPYH